MPGKDEFTFDDNDDFPETDLSSAFADGEHEAPTPVLVTEDETSKKKRRRGGKSSDGGGSKSKVLLLVLLLIVACGAGVYYFMDLGGTTPAAPKTAPAKNAKQTVALPPKPAKESTPQVKPPAEEVSVAAVTPAPAKVESEQKKVAVAAAPEVKLDAEKKPDTKSSSAAEPVAAAKPQVVADATEPQVVTEVAKPQVVEDVAKPVVVVAGPYALDAGSYLLSSNREMLVKKIKGLGYEPQITPVDATLTMTRLRLGRFPEGEAQEALTFARTIEPAAFSVRDGEQYVIYAGTYLKSENVEKLSQRFLKEGIRAEAIPVKVVRTLSRIHFGGFASKADAESVAHAAEVAGFEAKVIKVK